MNLQNTCFIILLNKVGNVFGDQHSEFWNHKTFESLSESILKKTGERISFTTLKRCWGKVSTESDISTTTLNILAIYVEYFSWAHFIQHCKEKNQLKPVLISTIMPQTRVLKFQTKYFIFLTIIFALIFTTSLFYYHYYKESSENLMFSVYKQDESKMSYKFYYDISYLNNEKANFITFGDADIAYISKDSHDLVHAYPAPNIYYPKLFINDILRKKISIIIPSYGWKFVIFNTQKNKKDTIPSYPNNYDSIYNLYPFENQYMRVLFVSENPIVELDSSKIELIIKYSDTTYCNDLNVSLGGEFGDFNIQIKEHNSATNGYIFLSDIYTKTTKETHPQLYVNYLDWDTLKFEFNPKSYLVKTSGNHALHIKGHEILGNLYRISLLYRYKSILLDKIIIRNKHNNIVYTKKF